MGNKIAVYTCITGGYDTPTDNFAHRDGYDYFLFSDKPITVNSWSNQLISFEGDKDLSNVKKQRYVKTHPFEFLPNYDIVVWVDGNTNIDEKLYGYIEENKSNLITFKKHPDRDCIYDEINICEKTRRITKQIADCVRNKLVIDKYPRNYGLFETNVIISHPKDGKVNLLFERWWDEIKENSHRDQLSLNYVIWKLNYHDIITVKDVNFLKPNVHIMKG